MNTANNELTGFVFYLDQYYPTANKIKRSYISSKYKTEKDLLDKIAYDLSFPGYFGCNWDALNDCINDFHWLDNGIGIEIVHQSLPSLPENELGIYLRILNDSVKEWQEYGQNRLHVFFPSALRDRIEYLLKMEHQRLGRLG